MTRQVLAGLAALLLAGVSADAAEKLVRVPCWVIETALATHGLDPRKDRAAARQAARARGYTAAQISDVEREFFK